MCNMNSRCPICFEELSEKSRATPDICDHIFCFPCLEQWSKHGSYCPVDRKRFRKIVSLDSETVIQVKPCRPKQSRILYDVTVYCEMCKKQNNAHTLLLCDCCDLGYHCKCLTPPLEDVPAGVWYCPVCVAVETRIKKPKDAKVLQHENLDQTNEKDIIIESGDSDCTRIQANYTRSNGNISYQEQYCQKEIEATSLKKDDLQNNIYEETIKCTENISANQINVFRSEEVLDKKEITYKNLRKDLGAKILDVEDNSIQSSIEKSERNNYRLEENYSWSMRLRRKELGLRTNEIESDSSTSQGTIDPNKNDLSPSLKRSNRLVKTINIPHHSSTSQNSIESNEANICLEKQAKNGSFSMILKDHHVKIIDIKNNAHAMKEFKPNNQEYGKNKIVPSLHPRKQDHASIKNNTVTGTVLTGFDFSEIPLKVIRRPSKNIHISENNGNKYTVPVSLRKRDNTNWKDLHAEAVGREELAAFHTNIASTLENIHNGQENGNKDLVPQSLRKIINKNMKDRFGEIIDSGEDLPASPTARASGNTHYSLEKDKEEITPPSLRMGDCRNWEDIPAEADSRENLSPSETNIARSASGILYQEKDIVPSIKKKENRNWKDFQEEAGDSGKDSHLLQTNIAINALGNIHHSQKNEKKDSEPPSQRNEENRNWKDFNRETIDNVEDSLLLLTNIARNSSGNIQHSQVNKKKDIVPSSPRKRDNRNWIDFHGETIEAEEDSTLHQTITARSMPWTIYNGQGNDKNNTVPCLRNSGNGNCRDLHEEEIYTFDDFPAIQTNIASRNIYNDNKSVALPSQQKCDNRNGRDLNGEILYADGDSLSTQANIEQSALGNIYSKQKHRKINILLQNDNRNSKDDNGIIIDIGVHSPAKQKNIAKTEWIIHSGQRPCKNDTASNLIKTHNRRDLNVEIIYVENDLARFQTNITGSELDQEEYNEKNDGFKSLSKKEVFCDRQDLYVDNENIEGKSPAIQSNISRSEDTIYNCQKESGRKGVSTNLMRLKTSLMEELESNNKANTDRCTSTNNTGVLIDRASSGNEKSCFGRKKSPPNSDFENLSLLSSKKNEAKSKSIGNWYKEEQKQAVCKNKISGMGFQAEVIPKNSHQVTSIRSTLCATPSNIKNFKFTKVCGLSPNFNNTDVNPVVSSSRFSVFEPLQDTFESSQKYLNMNMAINKMSCSSQSPLSLFSKRSSNPKKSKSIWSPDNFRPKNQKCWELVKKSEPSYRNSLQNSDLAHNPFSNYRSKEVDYAVKAKMNLAQELIKIEKEKWSQSLKKQKYSHLSRSACPKKSQKNTFNVCESRRSETTAKNSL